MDIVIKGGRVPNPIREWSEALLTPEISESIDLCSLPKGLILVTGPTGSGKSAAFLIPLITYLLTLPP